MLHKLIAILILINCLFLQAQNHLFRNLPWEIYNVKNGLPDNVINHITRDKNNYVWISTNFGLAKFNGKEFTKYNVGNRVIAIPHNAVFYTTFFNQNSSQKIFICTGNGITCLQEKNGNYQNINLGLEKFNLNYINGKINVIDSTAFIGTNSGLVILEKNKQHYVNNSILSLPNKQLPFCVVNTMRVKSTNYIFAANHIFKLLDNYKTINLFSFEDEKYLITSCKKINDSVVLLTGQNILCTFNLHSKKIIQNYIPIIQKNLPNSRIQIETAEFDNIANLWFGISNAGLYTIYPDGKMVKNILNNQLQYSGESRLHQVYFDDQNNLWVATDNGLFFLKNTHLQSEIINNVIWPKLNNNCRTLFINNNTFLIGSSTGISYKKDNQFINIPTYNNSIISVNAFCTNTNGDIYFGGTGGYGKLNYTLLKTKTHSDPIKLIAGRIWDMQIIRDTLWFCTLNGNLCYESLLSGKFDYFNSEIGQSFFCFYATKNTIILPGVGKIYLFNLHTKKMEQIDFSKAYSGVQFTTINKLSDNQFLIGTQGFGLLEFNLNHKTIKASSDFEALKNNIIFSSFSNTNKLIFGTNTGIYTFIKNNGKFIQALQAVSTSAGISFGKSLFMAPNNCLYVCQNDGLQMLQLPNKSSTNHNSVKLDFIQTNIANIDFTFHQKNSIQLMRGTKYIQLKLSNPSNINGNYTFWIFYNGSKMNIGKSGVYYIQKINPGKFTIKAACTETEKEPMDKDWQTMEFIVDAYFYQTYWFYGIIFTIGVLFVIWILKLWFNNYSNKKLAKQKELEANLSETKATNERLKAINMQMNPHFLFNTLSGIQGLVLQNKQNESISYISKFAKLIRELYANGNQKFINIEEEIAFVSKYCQLQQLRHPHIKIQLNNECSESCKIPPMLIQPFIENVFVHAFPYETDNCKLFVDYKEINNNISITIADNGCGITQKNTNDTSHFGISTIASSERLHTLFGENFKLHIESNNKMGTKINVIIPNN